MSGAYGYGTPFMESEAILAAQQEDLETVDVVLDAMLEGEREFLRRGCKRLIDAIDRHESSQR